MDLQSELKYKGPIFGAIGAGVGLLLALNSSNREASVIRHGIILGFILGSICGFLLLTIGHFYRNYFSSKLMAGAIILGIFGSVIGGIIGYSVESDKAWKVGQSYLQLLGRDIGLGGISGVIIGLIA